MSRFWDNLGAFHKEQLQQEGLENFRRTVAMRYFTDPRLENEGAIRALADKVKAQGVVIDIDDSPIGNPFLVEIDGHKVSQDLLISLYEIHSMGLEFEEIKTITEVGSGYGRIPYVILTKYPHIKYSIFDVEPAMSVQKYFLSQSVPRAKIQWNPKVIGRPNLCIAISVLTELDYSEIKHYFKIFEKAGYLYMKDWNAFNNRDDGTYVDRFKYPIPETWKELFWHSDPLTQDFFEAKFEINA